MVRRELTATPGGIELGPGMTSPEDLLTETVAILGKRGSGKATTARVLAEGLLDVDQPVPIVDPTGVWSGLRSSSDGTSDGYPVVIFGGDYGVVPLEGSAGDLTPEVVVPPQASRRSWTCRTCRSRPRVASSRTSWSVSTARTGRPATS